MIVYCECPCLHSFVWQCSKIRLSGDRIQKLKFALEEKRQKREFNNRKLTELKQKNEKLSKSLPKYEEKVDKLGTYVAGKQEDMENTREVFRKLQEELKYITKLRIQQLIQYIFPITKVDAKP